MRTTTTAQARPDNATVSDRGTASVRPGRKLWATQRVWPKVLAAAGKWFTRPAVPARIDSELAAIRTYAQFIAAHPDMPAGHRKRFLSMIMRSCEEIGDAFSWQPGGPVCKELKP